MKTCFTCHETKPLSEFTLRKPGGAVRSSCKACWNKRERLRNNSDKEKARVVATKEMKAIERDPYGFLAANIIEQAIIDYRDKKEMRGECLAFFCGSWFEELCATCEVDAEYMRKIILEQQDA